MASSGVNVLRYSALGAGIIYGITRQASITTKTKLHQAERERTHQAKLVERAHEEYIKRTHPQTGNGVISDPDDSRFDLEAYLNHKAAETT